MAFANARHQKRKSKGYVLFTPAYTLPIKTMRFYQFFICKEMNICYTITEYINRKSLIVMKECQSPC